MNTYPPLRANSLTLHLEHGEEGPGERPEVSLVALAKGHEAQHREGRHDDAQHRKGVRDCGRGGGRRQRWAAAGRGCGWKHEEHAEHCMVRHGHH